MEQFTLLNFFTVSIPEEFLMALFAWSILGKKDTIRFINVIIVGLTAAVTFAGTQFLLSPNITLVVVIQLILFILILYFTYKLSFIEAIVGGLLTMVVVIIIQAAVANLEFIVTGFDVEDLSKNNILKSLFFIPEFVILVLVSLLFYFKKVRVLNFKKKEASRKYTDKMRYTVLQLTFTFLIIIFNFRLYFDNKQFLTSSTERIIIIMNLLTIILFTVLALRSAFRMGESIQKEEELKRKLDGREIIQNIGYLCKLMDSKKYEEASNILKSIQYDVDSGIVNDNLANRDDSI